MATKVRERSRVGRGVRSARKARVRGSRALAANADLCVFKKDEMVDRFIHNTPFRNAVMSGLYAYQDNRVVLCHPDLLRCNNGKVRLANKVIVNPERYCLSQYKIKYPVAPRVRRYGGVPFLRRLAVRVNVNDNSVGVDEQIHIAHPKLHTHIKNDGEGIFGAAFVRANAYVQSGNFGDPELTFPELFSKYMEEVDFSTKELADKTGIDERTIRRMKTDEHYTPSLDYVVMCCLAMRLHFSKSMELIECGGYRLRRIVKKERAYKVLLFTFYACGDMDDYNRLLREMGVPTFSSILRKKKKK